MLNLFNRLFFFIKPMCYIRWYIFKLTFSKRRFYLIKSIFTVLPQFASFWRRWPQLYSALNAESMNASKILPNCSVCEPNCEQKCLSTKLLLYFSTHVQKQNPSRQWNSVELWKIHGGLWITKGKVTSGKGFLEWVCFLCNLSGKKLSI